MEQSYQGLHCLPFYLHITVHSSNFRIITGIFLVSDFFNFFLCYYGNNIELNKITSDAVHTETFSRKDNLRRVFEDN